MTKKHSYRFTARCVMLAGLVLLSSGIQAASSQVSDWLATQTDIEINEGNVALVSMGVARQLNISSTVQRNKQHLLAYYLDGGAPTFSTCFFQVELVAEIISEFGLKSRVLTHFRSINYTHATMEYFDPEYDKWVFLDPHYGTAFFNNAMVPASFDDMAIDFRKHGSNTAAWEYAPVRYWGPLDTVQVDITGHPFAPLDERDYDLLIGYYFGVTAIRYNDKLIGESDLPPSINGQWLIMQNEDRPEEFYTWFNDKYSYAYEWVFIDQRARGTDSTSWKMCIHENACLTLTP